MLSKMLWCSARLAPKTLAERERYTGTVLHETVQNERDWCPKCLRGERKAESVRYSPGSAGRLTGFRDLFDQSKNSRKTVRRPALPRTGNLKLAKQVSKMRVTGVQNMEREKSGDRINSRGRISNVQGEQPEDRMGTGNSEDIGTELKNGGRLLTQLPDKQSVHGVNFKNV